jgi:hypothetical protein
VLLQKPTGLFHISTIGINDEIIRRYIEKQYQEDVGQAQVALFLFKKVSPSTCHWHVFVTKGLDPWMFTVSKIFVDKNFYYSKTKFVFKFI